MTKRKTLGKKRINKRGKTRRKIGKNTRRMMGGGDETLKLTIADLKTLSNSKMLSFEEKDKQFTYVIISNLLICIISNLPFNQFTPGSLVQEKPIDKIESIKCYNILNTKNYNHDLIYNTINDDNRETDEQTGKIIIKLPVYAIFRNFSL